MKYSIPFNENLAISNSNLLLLTIHIHFVENIVYHQLLTVFNLYRYIYYLEPKHVFQ